MYFIDLVYDYSYWIDHDSLYNNALNRLEAYGDTIETRKIIDHRYTED